MITIALLVVIGVLCILSLAVGSRRIPVGTVWDALWHYDPSNDEHLVISSLRIPRTLLGLMVGPALGVAGVVMQSITRNPLAEPGILGVNAGAALAVAVGVGFLGVTGILGYVWFAFAGAALAGTLVHLLGRSRREGSSPVRLVLAGAALTVVLSSATQLILINFPHTFYSFRNWRVGTLQGRGYEILGPILIFVAVGVLTALAMCRSLDAMALGQDTGRALGVSPRRLLSVAAAVVVILAGSATAAAGPIAFVGLTAPHIGRSMVGNAHHRLLPMTMLVATVVVLAADILGRVIVYPGEVGTGVMTALIGGPFFVALVRRRRMVGL